MYHKELLVLLSVVVVLLACVAMMVLPPSDYSAVGDLFAAVGSVLAVIWFSASLYYQSLQLKEQREHFSEEFRQLREDARRSALVLSKDILREAEDRVLRDNPGLQSVNDLTTAYLDGSDVRIAIESKDPAEVLEAAKRFHRKQEGPAECLMRGIKHAAETYFRSIGKTDIDYSKEPEDFVLIYGCWLWQLPYFDVYRPAAEMLCQIMWATQPGRKALLLAVEVAMMKSLPAGFVKEDKIREDVERRRQAGLSLPAIAEDI